MKLALGALIALKFVVPLLILWFPFQASWANFVWDTIDGDILLRLGLDFDLYQTIDKVADYVTYIVMLVVGWRWKVKKTIIALFAIRTVGQVLFFATGAEQIFFFLPNFLEPFFMVYSFIMWKFKAEGHARYLQHRFLVWGIIVPYKMWNEWNTHIANIELSDVFFDLPG
jgi:hypothetical protein